MPSNLDLTPVLIQKEVLRDKLCDLLRGWILEGTLQPGARIVEYTLAARLKVSRAPLREALWLLSREGLVRLEAHHGAFVTKLDARDIREIFAIRQTLEIYAAQAAYAARSPETEARLRKALKPLKAAAQAKDMPAFSRADHEFHLTLWQVSGNRHLEETLSDLSRRFFGYELIRDAPHAAAYRFDAIMKLHQRMVELTILGDEHAIDKGFREIFDEFLRYVLSRFGES